MQKNNASVNKIFNLFTKHTVVLLSIFVLTSICFKLIYFQWNIPVVLDSLSYFFYASDIKIIEELPENYFFANMGWPLFLSMIFKIFSFENTFSFMEIQKLTSVVLSSLVTIPVFYLFKRYFSLKYCIIGTIFFVFEPRILENSFLGSSDQLFLLCSASALTLFVYQNKKLVFLSFIFAGLATITRGEGMMLFFAFSILYFLKFKNYKKTIISYLPNLIVFFVILSPILALQHQMSGSDMIFGRATTTIAYHAIEHPDQSSPSGLSFIISGFENFPIYFGWILIPIFLPYFPLGLYYFLRKINVERIEILIIGVSISIPLFYIYAIHIQETRYLLSLYPLITLVSLFAIKKIDEKLKRSIILFVIVALILISSISYLELKSNVKYQNEAYQINQYVYRNVIGINDFYPINIYLKSINISSEYEEFQKLFFEPRIDEVQTITKIKDPVNIISFKNNSIEEFILENNPKSLSHIIVQENDQNPLFLDLYNNEQKYTFLKNVFDTSNSFKKYKVKIFEIDYDLLNK